jgi:hypothetical protein
MLMGIGIAIDVTIATLSKFRDTDLSLKTWTVPITLTHIGFPAVGYYLFWGMSETLPGTELMLGVIGFTLVALFVYEVLCEAIGVEPVFGISSFISRVFGLEEDDSRRFIAILAVSWDALWSGPAKAAQAAAGNWSNPEVFSSFFVAGLTVAVIAQLALIAAKQLRRINFKNTKGLARFNFYGKFVELSVIGGFGVLSLWQGLGHGNLYQSIGISAVVLGIVFISFHKQMLRGELEEAADAISGEA